MLSSPARRRTIMDIAAERHTSVSTVRTHICNLVAKLRARNRAEVAIWAHEPGRVEAEGAPRG